MCFNVGVIIGPILGGVLADPVRSYPHIFGPNSLLGGKTGVEWIMKYPYATPNILNAVFIIISCICIFLGLEEVATLFLSLFNSTYILTLTFTDSRKSSRSARPGCPHRTLYCKC